MSRVLLSTIILGLLSATASADPCSVSIEANDMMQFSARTLSVPTTCPVIEVTLRHSGRQPARIMGHNWVLTRDSDVTAIASAGINAGLARNYQPAGDQRIIAATPIIGGGESATVRIDTSRLTPGGSYTYFCSAPGHASLMKGRLAFGARGVVTASNLPP